MRFLGIPVLMLVWLAGWSAAHGSEPEETLQAYIDVWSRDYTHIEFDDSRVANLLRSTASSHHELGLKQNATMKYGGLDVHHRLHVSFFSYPDQSARDLAIERWFDCFTILCDAVQPYENHRYTKSTPRFVIVNPTSIVALTAGCETVGEEWERNIEEAEAIFGEENYVTLRVGCGGPIEWTLGRPRTPN